MVACAQLRYLREGRQPLRPSDQWDVFANAVMEATFASAPQRLAASFFFKALARTMRPPPELVAAIRVMAERMAPQIGKTALDERVHLSSLFLKELRVHETS